MSLLVQQIQNLTAKNAENERQLVQLQDEREATAARIKADSDGNARQIAALTSALTVDEKKELAALNPAPEKPAKPAKE